MESWRSVATSISIPTQAKIYGAGSCGIVTTDITVEPDGCGDGGSCKRMTLDELWNQNGPEFYNPVPPPLTTYEQAGCI
jgi:hypothetical protein